MKKEKIQIGIAGLIIGIIAIALVVLGNPKNMGFCIACFLRDTAGGIGLHKAPVVQYIRPEIIGLVLGSLILSVVNKEFNPRGGSAPVTRFILGAFVMIGCLMFLGCPFRTILRLAGGDLNAIFGLLGYVIGILIGVAFLKSGYTLGRTYSQPVLEGASFSVVQIVLLFFVALAPAFIAFSVEGPGASHAPLIISLIAGLAVGALAQRTRLCMVGGVRDVVLFGETKLLIGFVAIFVSALIGNLILTAVTGTAYFKLGFEGQPVAHTDSLWNCIGMILAGFGSVLLGGCPMRQLVMAGEGNSDSAITIFGLMTGAAFAHNFGLASSGKGPTPAGKIAVLIGIAVTLIIAVINTKRSKN